VEDGGRTGRTGRLGRGRETVEELGEIGSPCVAASVSEWKGIMSDIVHSLTLAATTKLIFASSEVYTSSTIFQLFHYLPVLPPSPSSSIM
jgi:hypothetical protein